MKDAAPTVTDAEIIDAFERAEAAAGGPRKAEIKAVAHDIADALGVEYRRVRDVMLNRWAAGAG